MGSFSFGEMFTILVIVLIVFGPKRLPEMARRIGQILGRARVAVQDFTQTMQQEYGDEASAITGVVSDIDGIRKDIGTAMGTITGTSGPSSQDDESDDGVDDSAITDVTAFSDDDWSERLSGEATDVPIEEDRGE
jgi:Tat protein translocase TatB subunit